MMSFSNRVNKVSAYNNNILSRYVIYCNNIFIKVIAIKQFQYVISLLKGVPKTAVIMQYYFNYYYRN